MIMKVQMASKTPATDMCVSRNFESELNIVKLIASFIADSPYLQLIRRLCSNYTNTFKVASIFKLSKMESGAVGLIAEMRPPKIRHSSTDKL